MTLEDSKSTPRVSLGHVPELDGIRALAVSIVVAAHLGLEKYIPGGFGVTIFFFLSGYLITSLLRIEKINTGEVSLGAFYLRRTFRIMPPLYITLMFALILGQLGLIGREYTAGGVTLQALFLHNYKTFFGAGEGLPIPLWSLAVEEHFYLIFPLLYIVFLSKLAPSKAALWCLAACGVALVLRLTSLLISPEMVELNYTMSQTRMDSILFGCILAFWNNPLIDTKPWKPNIAHFLGALAVIAACLIIRNEDFRQTLRYTLQGVALFVIFSYVLQAGGLIRALLANELARWIGLLSYTVYLVHMVFIDMIEHLYPTMSPALVALVVLVLTGIYSYAMYRLIEKPAANIRKSLSAPGDLTQSQKPHSYLS